MTTTAGGGGVCGGRGGGTKRAGGGAVGGEGVGAGEEGLEEFCINRSICRILYAEAGVVVAAEEAGEAVVP